MDEKIRDVYVCGDINIDLILPGVREIPPYGQEQSVAVMATQVGGGAALFTLGLGKLGLKTVFQGAVGEDCYGEFIRKEMERMKVDTSLLHVVKGGKTGISISFTDETDRSFLTYVGTNGQLDLLEVPIAEVKKARHMHITGYEGRAKHKAYKQLLEQLKEEGITISFDVGWDESGEWYQGIFALLPYIDVLFMNEKEAMHYGRTNNPKVALRKFAKQGTLAVGKFGKKGSYAVQGQEEYEKKGYIVDAVDTTGAGDSFNAGFVYGFLKSNNIAECNILECLQYGNACGAMSVRKLGGNAGFPTLEEMQRFIRDEEGN